MISLTPTKGFAPIVLIIVAVLVVGGGISGALVYKEKGQRQTPLAELSQESQLPAGANRELCPDSICDSFELRDGICREDCAKTPGWVEKSPNDRPRANSLQPSGKKETGVPQTSLSQTTGGQLCPDKVCDDFELKNGVCREDCAKTPGWVEKQPSGSSGGATSPQGQVTPPSGGEYQPTSPTDKIYIKPTGTSYRSVSSKPSGWLKTGQEASIMLSGHDFNNSGGPLAFNHPGTIDSDGTRLILADRSNNRVLLWKKLPENGNTNPDIVLGQKSFYTNNSGSGLSEMNWPTSVSVGGNKLIVADTNNDRILIWNSIPSVSGQPADFAIMNNIRWPWGTWTDGKKMAVVSTGKGTILLWNTFPTTADRNADISISGGSIGTPRMASSNGENLIIGDHNAKVTSGASGASGQAGPGGSIGTFFWKSWPTQNNQPHDFFMPDQGEWKRGDFTASGKLVLLSDSLKIWNSFPAGTNDFPDIETRFKFLTGDGSGLTAVGEKLYISSYNGNKIIVYNSLPASGSSKPNFAIGVPAVDDNGLERNFILGNPVPATDGKSLFISADFDCKLYVWKNLPDESGAHPDLVFEMSKASCPWDNALYKNTLATAGKGTVFVWNSLPTEARQPDKIFRDRIGSVNFGELRGVALDDRYFYLADWTKNKIYVWEGVPESSSEPKFSIDAYAPTRMTSDGKYLAVASMEQGVKIFDVSNLSSGAKPVAILGDPRSVQMNLPQDALISHGRFFVADTNNSRVLIWNKIESALGQKQPDIILGEKNLTDTKAETAKDKLFWPGALAFDGSFLWVGEFKFSVRVLRFDAN